MPLSIPHLPVPLNDYQGHCYLRPPKWRWLLTAPENQDLGGKGVLLKSGAEGGAIFLSMREIWVSSCLCELSQSQGPFIAAMFLPLGFWKAGIPETQR